jgi:hypothetical protein
MIFFLFSYRLAIETNEEIILLSPIYFSDKLSTTCRFLLIIHFCILFYIIGQVKKFVLL